MRKQKAKDNGTALTSAVVVTAEDAERMYAQAWPAKQAQVGSEIQAALEAIGQQHGVTIRAQLAILPAFLASEPVRGQLPIV